MIRIRMPKPTAEQCAAGGRQGSLECHKTRWGGRWEILDAAVVELIAAAPGVTLGEIETAIDRQGLLGRRQQPAARERRIAASLARLEAAGRVAYLGEKPAARPEPPARCSRCGCREAAPGRKCCRECLEQAIEYYQRRKKTCRS